MSFFKDRKIYLVHNVSMSDILIFKRVVYTKNNSIKKVISDMNVSEQFHHEKLLNPHYAHNKPKL